MIVEVGPRDGLQNERGSIDTATKVGAGRCAQRRRPVRHRGRRVREPPVGAADGRYGGGLPPDSPPADVRYTALVPNLEGTAARARLRRVRGGHLRRSIGDIQPAQHQPDGRRIARRVRGGPRQASAGGVRVRAYLSTAFGCPFEGRRTGRRVGDVAARLRGSGCLSNRGQRHHRRGAPGPGLGRAGALERRLPLESIALHFHDTRGTALANVLAGLEAGVQTFDASAGGLGGCPYAPGAAGNLATEDLVYMLDGLEVATGIHLEGVSRASELIEPYLGHPLPSRYVQAMRGGSPGGKAEATEEG